MKNNIAILYTTFYREELMYRTLGSILSNWHENYILLIGDQSYSTVKQKQITELMIKYKLTSNEVQYYKLPLDCGLSFARNYLVTQAKEQRIPYCLLTADSLEFTNRYHFEPYIKFLESDKTYGIIGFDIANRIDWEFNIEKTNAFELIPSNDFIDYGYMRLKVIDICRNFFIAKTNVLIENPWDNKLKMAEHEDFFWRLKNTTKYKVFYNNLIQSKYIRFSEANYNPYRRYNFHNYVIVACKKWDLKVLFRERR